MDLAMTNETKPNYRIYERLGGYVTHDIYAADLPDAIRQGREWIEDGDYGDGEFTREIAMDLPCEVARIIRSRGRVNDEKTAEGEMHDCSGRREVWEPRCRQGRNTHAWEIYDEGQHGYEEKCHECGMVLTVDRESLDPVSGRKTTRITFSEPGQQLKETLKCKNV